jgi:hypothetical protein
LGAPKSEKSLSDWIVSALRTQPRSLEDLKRLLANAPMLRDHEWPGRAINFALVGLQKGGHVERASKTACGSWLTRSETGTILR